MERLLLWLQRICLQRLRARPPQSPKEGSIQSGNEKAFMILCVLVARKINNKKVIIRNKEVAVIKEKFEYRLSQRQTPNNK